jgi:hypothetical protein
MRFLPQSVGRAVAEQALRTQKHAPEILFGAGVVSMVGSTVMACRATLKLEEVLDKVEADKAKAHRAKELVDAGEVPDGTTYTESEMKRDLTIITVRGVTGVIKLYAPAVILGGVGVICLTKSHKILQERNAALTAAYVAIDTAFRQYRSRVVDRYGEDIDRELRYDAEEVDIIDEETGKITSTVQVTPGEPSGYARWFDEENTNWNPPQFHHHNTLFLRNQQNWANDMLRSRGHVFLNEVYSMVGLSHTSAGAIVGWVYDRHNDRGDNYIDFGCWGKNNDFNEFFNGREGAILLDFNVDGPIWELIDARQAKLEEESGP